MKLRLFLISGILALGASLGFAQAPQEFNYQAVIRDASGNVLPSQAVGLEISIRQGTPGGTIVYTETHATTTSNIGLVNVSVGGGTVTSGTFSSIDWGAGPYYIEIGLDATGGTSYTAMGTQQLLSVPYALYAESVTEVDGDSTNEIQTLSFSNDTIFLTDGGNVDLSAYAVDNVNDADADSTNELQVLSISNDTIFLTDGGFAVLPASGGGGNWTLNGSDIYNSNAGNVGIGDNTPAYTLTVHNGTDPVIATGRNSFNQAVSGKLVFDEDVDDNVICGFMFDHNGANNTLELITGCNIPTAGDTSFRITRNNGNLLLKNQMRIGSHTLNPTSDLDIEQSASPSPNPGTGGITLKSDVNNNEWQIWYSNPNLSFAYNNTRVAYINEATGAWVTTSDRRYKKDIEPMENVLDKVLMLEPVKYLYKQNENGSTKQRGFIAQDVESIFPDLVYTEDGTQLALDRADFGVLAIKAIQEQQLIIDQQNQTINQQNEIIQDLINRIEKLEGK